jgi:hypothetical protein
MQIFNFWINDRFYVTLTLKSQRIHIGLWKVQIPDPILTHVILLLKTVSRSG